ncbi:hypothetical protein [Brachyspira aalborgi]|jgi:hypothetical protein|uniref:DUF3592 domain-containing protein n=1 Tax=Brachyspira aalborgi TaxID=29522 RepID=A0AB38PZ81_9SPIR|nr:hypothetical protein [Brachyspira aalborgi]MBS4763427.1 hypothetical protein [Brachyspira sp.]CCY75626.1 putative uncharacterized protein [Brachyspira sp. CAG:700]TXJ24549.1 hypothetical protein EPJ73_12040 [Brachyspira aalborgi]TXJ32959.1 hypothetical protein EPJ71_05305 [Brachyspira aalborgi]TXJ41657.1 hypothetical protein EPJ65_08525 [Brachyspira aalborgi]
MDFSTFITSIIFILPGFIVISSINLFSYVRNVNTFYKILQSIITTIILWLFVFLISQFEKFNFIDNILEIIISFDINIFLKNKIKVALFLITIYFISFLIGFIIGIFLYRWDKTRNFIYKIYVKIFNQTPYKHIWEELFYELKINEKNVVSIIVRTVNGDIFMGLPYLISYNPNDRAISFLELYKLNDKNKFELIINYEDSNINNKVKHGDLFYIKDSSIEYLYILYYNEKRVNDLIDKLR